MRCRRKATMVLCGGLLLNLCNNMRRNLIAWKKAGISIAGRPAGRPFINLTAARAVRAFGLECRWKLTRNHVRGLDLI